MAVLITKGQRDNGTKRQIGWLYPFVPLPLCDESGFHAHVLRVLCCLAFLLTPVAAQSADTLLGPSALRQQSRQAQREYIAELQRRIATEPNNLSLQLDLGRAHYWLALGRDFEAVFEAERVFTGILQRVPNHALALAYHGMLQGYKIGNNLVPPRAAATLLQQSIREMDRAVALAPDDIEVRELRGYSSFYTPSIFGRDSVAVGDFRHVLQLLESAPRTVNERARIWLILGDTYRKIGELEHARASWEQTRALTPGGEFDTAVESRLKSLEGNSAATANAKEVIVFFGFLIGALIFGVLSALVLRDLWRAQRKRRGMVAALFIALAALAWNAAHLLLTTAQALGLPLGSRSVVWHEHGWLLLLALLPIPFGLMAAYRFYQATFMDIALKRGVTLALLVTVSLAYAQLMESRVAVALLRVTNPVLRDVFMVGAWLLLLACYAPLRDAVYRMVDRRVFRRRDYARVLDELNERLREAVDEHALLAAACAGVREALAADPVEFLAVQAALAQRLAVLFTESQATVLLRTQLADAELEAEFARHQIEIALVLRVNGEVVRVLVCGPRAYGQGYLSEELSLLRALAAQLNRALENQRLHEARRKHAIAEEELRKLVAQSELKALRAQIDPHFFFNALNSVAALIQREPRAAEELLEDVAELFRHAFKQKPEFVTLAEELELVETYLKVERVRLGAKLQVKMAVLPETRTIKIPALTIQPLVENAVKHGLGCAAHGGVITLSAVLCPNGAQDGLKVIVADTGVGIAPAQLPEVLTRGVGLSNVNERLVGLYGSAARLRIDSSLGQGTTVAFTVPLEAERASIAHA